MVNVSGGMAAATLLLAAVMAPAALGYMDFEVSSLKLSGYDPKLPKMSLIVASKINCSANRIHRKLGYIICETTKQWKKNKFGHFVVVVQLIHRLTQADISYTATARLFFFPLLGNNLCTWPQYVPLFNIIFSMPQTIISELIAGNSPKPFLDQRRLW